MGRVHTSAVWIPSHYVPGTRAEVKKRLASWVEECGLWWHNCVTRQSLGGKKYEGKLHGQELTSIDDHKFFSRWRPLNIMDGAIFAWKVDDRVNFAKHQCGGWKWGCWSQKNKMTLEKKKPQSLRRNWGRRMPMRSQHTKRETLTQWYSSLKGSIHGHKVKVALSIVTLISLVDVSLGPCQHCCASFVPKKSTAVGLVETSPCPW